MTTPAQVPNSRRRPFLREWPFVSVAAITITAKAAQYGLFQPNARAITIARVSAEATFNGMIQRLDIILPPQSAAIGRFEPNVFYESQLMLTNQYEIEYLAEHDLSEYVQEYVVQDESIEMLD